jgi:hypothetical protein
MSEQFVQHYVKQTPDKNAAAEQAFQACASEEQDLRSYSRVLVGEPWASGSIDHVRAAMKSELIKEGRISNVPER